MRTYDRSFVIVARTRVHIPEPDIAAAEQEVDRRLAAGEDVTIAKVLIEIGKLDALKVTGIEAAMRRFALECTKCGATTYLLPRQEEKDVRCEKCGEETRRVLAPAKGPKGKTATTRTPRTTREYARAGLPDEGAVPAPDPVPGAIPVPGAVPVPAPAPGAVPVPAASPIEPGAVAGMLSQGEEPTFVGRLASIPRAAWIAGAVLSLLIAAQAATATSKLSGYEAQIGEEVSKLNRFAVDVRAKTIEILKKDGLAVKPDEIQLIVFEDISRDSRLFGYVTVRSSAIHFQVKKRFTAREAVDIACANGFELVKLDHSKIWPDGPSAGRQLRLLGGICLGVALGFIAWRVKAS